LPVELPDDAVRIRNLYPICKIDSAMWKRIIELTRDADKASVAEAEALAKAHMTCSPRNRALHVGAVRKRGLRRSFLAAQKRGEVSFNSPLRDLSDRATGILVRSGKGGIIPPARYPAIVEALTDANHEAYKQIASSFRAQLRGSVKLGLKDSMKNAEAVVANAKARRARESELDNLPSADRDLVRIALDEGAGEVDYLDDDDADLVHLGEANPLAQTLTYSANSSVFKKLFKGALRDTMTAGLFGDNKISARVWDLRGGNMAQMKRMLASGIAAGDDPATISRDIRGILIQPNTLRGNARAAARPGAGVYRSAYANALRLTRTETNRAYILSDTIFADDKGWNLIWVVSTGQREFDECLKTGTLIRTIDGDVNVEDVREGDLVLTHKNRWQKVIRTFKNKNQARSLIRLCFRAEKNRIHEIFCTPNHPFLIDGEWIAASDLQTGFVGTVLTSTATLVKKETVAYEDEFTYNLAVEGDNSYFANGIAVHNCDALGGKEMTPGEFADKYPVHSQCLCFSTLAPKKEFDSVFSDTPADT